MAALLPLALLAGCDGGEPGTPTATNTGAPTSAPGTTPTTPSAAAGKAPTVTNPLDASAFVADPCKSLADAQRNDFAMDKGTLESEAKDPICSWRSGPSKVSIGVWYVDEYPDGLNHVYQQNDAGFWKEGYFEPTEVSGYPAVFVDIGDGRPDGMCVLSVGVRTDLYFTVHVGLNTQGDDGCVAAENVAAAVVETIKGGA